MKKIVSIIFVASLALASLFVLDSCSTNRKVANNVASNAPNYKQIKKVVETESSEFYYPELLRRFQEADTTLTPEQVYHFYYGTATLSSYDPYGSDHMKEVHEVLSGDTITEENWQQAAQLIETHLEKDPTNLRFHFYKQIVCSKLYGVGSKEHNDAVKQMRMLVDAVMMSGDGRSLESAIHVNSVPDEYGLLEVFGFSPKSQSLVEKHGRSYDAMALKENKFGLKTMYFDVTKCMESLSKKFQF